MSIKEDFEKAFEKEHPYHDNFRYNSHVVALWTAKWILNRLGASDVDDEDDAFVTKYHIRQMAKELS